MTLKVEFNHPEMEKDAEFDLGGFLVPNGGSVELSEEQEIAFIARHRMKVKDKLANNPTIKVSGKSEISSKDMEVILGVDVSDLPEVEEEEPEVEEEVPATEEVEGSDN